MDFDEDDLGNSQDSQQFRQGYFIYNLYTDYFSNKMRF